LGTVLMALDAVAIGHLSDITDRCGLVRFYQQQTLSEVGNNGRFAPRILASGEYIGDLSWRKR
jgi:hypothetical protein